MGEVALIAIVTISGGGEVTTYAGAEDATSDDSVRCGRERTYLDEEAADAAGAAAGRLILDTKRR